MGRGGARKGSGRPKGKGKYNEETKAIRLPLSLINALEKYHKIPLYSSSVSAGFPSPAEDYIEEHLDLNDYLIKHPAATFMVRAVGDSMINAGIHENDILIVDRSLTPVHGRIVIAAIDGQLTVKRLCKNKSGKYQLVAENPKYKPIELNDNSETHIWGVVTSVIHSV